MGRNVCGVPPRLRVKFSPLYRTISTVCYTRLLIKKNLPLQIHGIGKTTLIQKVSEVLATSKVDVDGFYTEEVRQGQRRIGFDVVTTSGHRGKLARISSDVKNENSKYRVGQYFVDIVSFEQLVLPLLDRIVLETIHEVINILLEEVPLPHKRGIFYSMPHCAYHRSTTNTLPRPVCVIDEIGKMELFSKPFILAVDKILDNPSIVVFGTLPLSRGRLLPFVEEVKHRQDIKLFNVTRENRDEILHEIVTTIQDCSIEKSK